MAANPTIVASLVEFYSAEEIRAAWEKAFNALASRSKEVIHINSSTSVGRSTAGIALSTPQEMNDFIDSCRAALLQKQNNPSTPASELGSSTDFSRRILSV
jgi:hypothetical protein